MLSTEAVIGICMAVSVSFLFTGSMISVWFLRYRDRKRHLETLSRGLSSYHRAHLSVDGSNYSHIFQPPMVSLRRSRYLTYSDVPRGWTEMSSDENLRPQQMVSIQEQPGIDATVSPPKRRRSLRQTLYGHSLNVPKTRRQKKIEKTIAKNSLPLSPLSAITEFTGSPETPSPQIVELPTSITPKETPERQDPASQSWRRPVSIQWPLPIAMRRSKNTLGTTVTSIPVRDSILIRKGSMEPPERSALRRSVSMNSNISSAPEGPLPPLPLRHIRRFSQKSENNNRQSNASIETVGSSVLGSKQNSPEIKTSYNPATPTVDLSSPGLHQFSPVQDQEGSASIMMGTAAGRRARTATVNGNPSSFRASIRDHTSLRKVNSGRTISRSDQTFNNFQFFDDSLETIDSSNWNQNLLFKSTGQQPKRSPSFSASSTRRPGRLHVSNNTAIQPLVSKRASNPVEKTSAAEILTGSPRQFAPPRPASVASSNPYQWDLKPPLFVSPLQLKKGHKRQNCVRISNLPTNEPKLKGTLPGMMEEGEEEEAGPVESKPKIPGLTLLELENGTPALRARASLVDIKASPSPFHNRPILEPTSRKCSSHRRQSGTEVQSIPRRDSDVFINCQNGPTTPSLSHRGGFPDTQPKWPLSPTPRNNIKLNSTPPTLSAISEPFDPDSPILPSPALTSATLFPPKSGVQGPRNLPASSTRSSRAASPSPLHRAGTGAPSRRVGDELRRSIMMMRRQTSEGKLLDSYTSRLYRNMGDQSVSNFSLPTTASPSQSPSNLGVARGSIDVSNSNNCNTSASNTALKFDADSRRHGSHLGLSNVATATTSDVARGGVRTSRSKMSISFSPSAVSLSDVSIWEDASICDDLDLETRNSMLHMNLSVPEQATLGDHYPDGYENFVLPSPQQQQQGRGYYVDRTLSERKDREREDRLTSPQGKGLGILVSSLGTPGSLYDRDGFLKE